MAAIAAGKAECAAGEWVKPHAGGTPSLWKRNIRNIRNTGAAGVEFTNDDQPGVRLSKG